MSRHPSVACALALLLGCAGGGGPSQTPDPPASGTSGEVTYVLLDGLSGQPVQGSVTAGGQTRFGARVTLGGVPRGAEARIEANGFLARRVSVLEYRELEVRLWPNQPGLEARRTQELVYHPALERVAGSTMYVTLDPELRTPENYAAMRDAASRLSVAAGWLAAIVADDPPPGSVVCRIKLTATPEGGFSAITERSLDERGAIARAVILFAREDLILHETVRLHELGHAFGFGHLNSFEGLMSVGAPALGFFDFSPAEVAIARLYQYRDAGNRFPDDGREVGSIASTGPGSRVVCRFPSLAADGPG